MVSIVILANNRVAEVLVTLKKVTEYLKPYPDYAEIIVVDNASIDDTSAKVKQEFPQVNLVTKIKNNGIAGWNDGFAVARHKYILVLDDDSHIEQGLPEAIKYLDSNPEIGVLALNIKGGKFTTKKVTEFTDKKDCIGFIGCGAIIRKELYEKIGGFSEWLYMYTHEYEYGIRCLEAGYKIKYFEDCKVIHRASSVNRSGKNNKVFSVRNEMGIVYKYFNKDKRNIYLTRVFLNNLKDIYWGRSFYSIPWYITALKEFFKLKKTLVHTPVRKEVEETYSKAYWSTRPFIKKQLLGRIYNPGGHK